MKKNHYLFIFLISSLFFYSCTDDLVIDGGVDPNQASEQGNVDGESGVVKLTNEMEDLMDITITDESISFDPCHQASVDQYAGGGYYGGAGGPSDGVGTTGGDGSVADTDSDGLPDYADSSSDGDGIASDSEGDSGSDTASDYILVGGSGQELTPGVLTAGETKDLEEWEYWSGLSGEFSEFQDKWAMFPSNRVSVEMRDSEGNPHIDLPMFLLNADDEPIWTTRTDNAGSAELWVNPESGVFESVRVATVINDEVVVYDYDAFDSSGTQVFTTAGQAQAANSAEITIAFDATGSMGDELEYIKVEATDIFDRVVTDNPGIDFKFSSVFYRDYGDAYLEVAEPMTSSSETVIDFINSQSAQGGGDFPEAVHRALQLSVVDMEWQAPARTRIMFLILDAPPHEDECTIERMQLLVRESARKGIKIIPVTASGINKNTEYLMRFCALLTNGTYTYITDDSGIGNDHLEASVDAVEVEFLNDLMVRLVNEYLQ